MERRDMNKSKHLDEVVYLDEVVVVAPPPRRKGKIKVRLVYKGRGKPPTLLDPWDY
jgi:hypothetical protein